MVVNQLTTTQKKMGFITEKEINRCNYYYYVKSMRMKKSENGNGKVKKIFWVLGTKDNLKYMYWYIYYNDIKENELLSALEKYTVKKYDYGISKIFNTNYVGYYNCVKEKFIEIINRIINDVDSLNEYRLELVTKDFDEFEDDVLDRYWYHDKILEYQSYITDKFEELKQYIPKKYHQKAWEKIITKNLKIESKMITDSLIGFE